ncbi:MAG: serine/threonine-protein kinase [Deltaproteobacteria bacterium]
MGYQQDFVMPYAEGQILAGKYEVIELIGVGGIGFVLAATHVELGEKVALKFLRPDALANEEAVGRFAREARASVQIKSEHVARVFDVGNLADGSPFIVMEYLEGKDLGAVLHERGALPIKLAVEYVLQACEALAEAHARGVVHRDVKPENLFLNRPSQGVDMIKVLDFGISKVALTGSSFETRHPLAQTTMAMGSPTYMSPEQVRASHDIDARTDVWSLGCVLYELLTGQPAFDAPSLTQISAAILEAEPTSLRLACPMAPPGLEAVVKHCLAKHPAGRFQNVGELAIALYPYGSPRGQISVERCCSLLRSAGISQQDFEIPSIFPASSPDHSLSPFGGLEVVHSTPILEDPITLIPRSSPANKRWFAALGLIGAAALGYAILAARGSGMAPASDPLLETPAVAAARPVVSTVVAPPAHTSSAAQRSPPPVQAAPAAALAPVPLPAESAPVVAPLPKPSASLVAAASAKRRAPAPPAPKPKPVAAPAKPSATAAGEPDIGF